MPFALKAHFETQGSLAVPGSLAARNDKPELSKNLQQFRETESLRIQSEEESNQVFYQIFNLTIAKADTK